MKPAFTLIETFVAISILLVAVLGPMSLFAQAISDGIFAKNQVTAFYLAQEGVEMVLNQTYTNDKIGTDDGVTLWDDTLRDCDDDGCRVGDDGSQGIKVDPCNTTDCGQIYFNSDTGVYSNNPANGQKTIFSRVVVVKKIVGTDDIKKVSSTVSWYNQVIPKSVTIDRYIYNLNIAPTGVVEN